MSMYYASLSVPEMRSWYDCGCCACYTRAADARGLNSPSCVQSVHRIHLTKNSEVVLVEDLVYPRGNRGHVGFYSTQCVGSCAALTASLLVPV